MPKETELKAFERLELEGQVARSQVPRKLLKSEIFHSLTAAGILGVERKGAGQVIRVLEPEDFQVFLDRTFPGRKTAVVNDGVGNVLRYRNSKGAQKDAIGIVLLRGNGSVILNGKTFDLAKATRHFGCAACLQPALQAPKVCLVENLDTFMQANTLLGDQYTYLHTYGRLGGRTFNALEAEEILHFGDFDYTGLDEFLRLKERFPLTKLHLPDNLETFWHYYSRPLKTGAVTTRRLRNSKHPDVLRVLKLLSETNRFLEQQALFLPQNPSQ
jgi:hypothetical protein